MMKRIYLDYNATTPLDPRVLEAMMPYFKDDFGNPSSIHSLGMRGKGALDTAREQVAGLIKAHAREIIFTSGGSESNNFAIKGAAYGGVNQKGSHLITTSVEHESVLETFRFLEKEGFRVTYLGVDKDGLVDLDELDDALTDDTALVSCMYANNETGAVMPIGKIAEMVKEKGVIFHTDAVQAAGKIDIDTREVPADLLSISAHKFYGPKGAGVLYLRDGVKNRVRLGTLIHGGGQERGFRSGTENVPGIAGLGIAAEIAGSEMKSDENRVRALRDTLWESLSSCIGNIKLNGMPENILRNTLNVLIGGVSGDALAMALDLEGIAVATGSACSQGKVDPSHVLMAMGLSREEAASSVRFSLGRFTAKEDIYITAQAVRAAVERIRGVGGRGAAAI
jgi:cysteine desulfurase